MVSNGAIAWTPAEIFERNQRLVAWVLGSIRHRPCDREDLLQEGRLGLWRAAATWDPARGAAFIAYAKLKIRGAILDAIRANNGLVHIPRPATEALRARRRRVEVPILSLHQPVGDDFSGATIAAVLEDPAPPVGARLEAAEGVDRVLHRLPVRIRAVVELYAGLTPEGECCMREIAGRLRMSESRVSQLLKQARWILRA